MQGFLLGWVNGIITVKYKIPSFITTLGTMMLWRGILLAVTGGFAVRYWGTSSFLHGLNGHFLGEFRTSSIWFFVVIFLLNTILVRTPYGFARFNSVDPLRGTGMELEAIAAVVVGGTLMSGGYGNLIGTLFGVLLMGMVRSGLIMSGAPAYWYQAFIGIILMFKL